MDDKESILIVDDDESTRRLLSLIFDRKGYETETAGTGHEAMEKVKGRFFNLALLDIRLPDIEGIDLLAPLKEMQPDMVVIMITGYASLDTAVRALNEGASAYITKPLSLDEMLVPVRETLEKQRLEMESRRVYREAQRELAERKRREQQLAYMATHDPLTGLPNRMLFNDRLTLELAHAHRNRQKLAVMLLDLDHFKDINDTLGHSVGDQLLQAVGDRLRGLLRKNDTVARMGGDEFLLSLPEIARVEDAAKIAKKILQNLREPFAVDGHKLHITTSIGIAIYPKDGQDGDTLMKHADNAMYSAKKEGRNNYQR